MTQQLSPAGLLLTLTDDWELMKKTDLSAFSLVVIAAAAVAHIDVASVVVAAVVAEAVDTAS